VPVHESPAACLVYVEPSSEVSMYAVAVPLKSVHDGDQIKVAFFATPRSMAVVVNEEVPLV
jgi:hypothetical protein